MSVRTEERRAVLIVAAVQFVNVLDFMMVMPLGPDFAAALRFPASDIGYLAGAYAAAAAAAGVAGSIFLDRFDRRPALAAALCGLAVATALGGLAANLETLLATRILAGLFGGPAVALGIAIVADTTVPERRGRAVGIVMGSFSLAAVFGLPAGLELARLGGWRLPFFTIAGLGAVVACTALLLLRPQPPHLPASRPPDWRKHFCGLFTRRPIWLAYAVAVLLHVQAAMVIPNISAYVQGNLEVPRERIALLYLIGGVVSFAGMRAAGWLVDRLGPGAVTLGNTLLTTALLWMAFIDYRPWMSPLLLFPLFMLTSGLRMVANNATFSLIPRPHERAGFMALISTVQHGGAALGAVLSAQILDTAPDGRLLNVAAMAGTAIALGLAVPPLMFALERTIRPATDGGQSAAASTPESKPSRKKASSSWSLRAKCSSPGSDATGSRS